MCHIFYITDRLMRVSHMEETCLRWKVPGTSYHYLVAIFWLLIDRLPFLNCACLDNKSDLLSISRICCSNCISTYMRNEYVRFSEDCVKYLTPTCLFSISFDTPVPTELKSKLSICLWVSFRWGIYSLPLTTRPIPSWPAMCVDMGTCPRMLWTSE